MNGTLVAMAASFFFYDLETSGVNPRSARVMQFAGQRTTLDLAPIGEPVNIIIRLTPDVVPEPDAILITGITPQQTLQEGITEAEFLALFQTEIATPDTIFAGFNTVRFDDEFMRYMHYRNFYDPYEWQWQDGRSRWDLLDVVRMTRALRPDGIKWPFDSKGKPTNRLELLTGLNGLDHENAHDALNDVLATIAIAKLLREKQPKLFEYLLTLRDKKAVAALVNAGQPFVYSSGKYASEFEKTTAAMKVVDHPQRGGAIVFDVRHDPTPFLKLSPEQLASKWQFNKETRSIELPAKTLQFNRCPAVAPLGVLDAASQKRLSLDLSTIAKHAELLRNTPQFGQNLVKAIAILDTQRQTTFLQDEKTVDAQLYDGFIDGRDKTKEREVRAASPEQLSEFAGTFSDARLNALLPLYKARNFSDALTPEERANWDEYCSQMLMKGGTKSSLARYFARLGELAESPRTTESQRYLLEELQIYGQSIMPVLDEFAE